MQAPRRMSCRSASGWSTTRSTSPSIASPSAPRDRPLKRLGNILENPQAAIVFDHYDEDWRRLAWVMLRGRAEILADGPEHGRAQALLQARYSQLAAMQLAELPVIAIRIERVASWGDLGD